MYINVCLYIMLWNDVIDSGTTNPNAITTPSVNAKQHAVACLRKKIQVFHGMRVTKTVYGVVAGFTYKEAHQTN